MKEHNKDSKDYLKHNTHEFNHEEGSLDIININ